jgi:transcriptional regulator GlxA family with amidase domain
MPAPIPVAIYLHRRAALGFALLLDTVFKVANRFSSRPVFALSFVAEQRGPRHFRHGICLRDCEARLPRKGYFLIPPLDGFSGEFAASAPETRFLQRAHQQGLTIGSACLGAFLPAAAGLLDGREATTHWRCADYASTRFPAVQWNPRAMLCAHEDIVTAGGLLATVDLALHIVARHCPKAVCREVGQHLLADSVRQKQSTYAGALVVQPRNRSQFQALEQAICERLGKPFPIPEMAQQCHMSLRSFHRAFIANYSVSPGKYLQLRRVERAKELLADLRLTIDDVASRCGFTQPSFFRTIFARETGLTPTQFRQRL